MISLKVTESGSPTWMEFQFKIPLELWRELLPTIRKYENVSDGEYPNVKRKEELTDKFLNGQITESDYKQKMEIMG